jgi:hypothetical protein
MRVGTFVQEIATMYGKAEGLPDEDVSAIVVGDDKAAYAGTAKGIGRFADGGWKLVAGVPQTPIAVIAKTTTARPPVENCIYAVAKGSVYEIGGQGVREIGPAPEGAQCLSVAAMQTFGTDRGLVCGEKTPGEAAGPFHVEEINALLGADKEVRAIVTHPKLIAVAAKSGLFSIGLGNSWNRLFPQEVQRSWAPVDVRGAAFDNQLRLWFASPQGVGCLDEEKKQWKLYTSEEGLPYDDFTAVAAGGDGSIWFGTTKGAIRFDGETWEYRQGRRWLPDDHVRAIAVAENGDAWIATPKGVARIERNPITFKEKARFYEECIDKYHRRTPYGYVIEAQLKRPGDRSTATTSDSDNDGLWTGMYGAGECFAYAATKSPDAQGRAKAAFEALRFLGEVTQGGPHPAPKGFVARSILPTSGPNPNEKDYTREKDEQERATRDALWKVIHPRWPTSADGQWYWKCDTSSDELDGHYFFYACYYDLAADTEAEKQRVREVVAAITDHLIDHEFCLVDWDGTPTRWAVFGPQYLNHDPAWVGERGLNSLSMLSYLAVAYHMTGAAKYRDAFDLLVNEHGYAMNLMVPKAQTGPGSGNQSDDEMAFMSFYDLIKYAPDPKVKAMAGFAFANYWMIEQPELNPFFNFAYAGAAIATQYADPYGTYDLSPKGAWLEQSVDTLRRFPLDLCNWRLTNSHRKDIIFLAPHARERDEAKGKGCRRNGLVLPVDERHFNHWNTDPWDLDTGGQGTELSDGAVFLLPYYMGLHLGFIIEE